MNKIGVVILARLSSRRLPGKALLKINDKEVLKIIYERINSVFKSDEIVLATSVEKEDDKLIEFCTENKINYYRGDLDNVSERFFNAAVDNNFDYAIRINGDNVLIDIPTLEKMKLLAEENIYNFITNVDGRTFPTGMSIEILKTSYYGKLMSRINKSDYYKEHVTKYIYDNLKDDKFNYVYNIDVPESKGTKLALDTKEDFKLISKIFEAFNDNHINYNLKEITQIRKKVEDEF